MANELQKIRREDSDIGDVSPQCNTGSVRCFSGCIYLQCARQGLFQCPDGKCGTYESAYDDGRMGKSFTLFVPGNCVCPGSSGGRADRS